MSLPLVGILARRELKGWDVIEDTDDLFFLDWLPLDQALEIKYTTDAHFVSYEARGPMNKHRPVPRLNKVVIPRLRELGLAIQSTVIAVEFDNPDHKPWNASLLTDFQHSLEEAIPKFPLIANPTAFYFTNAGARWIFALTKPVDLEMSERIHAGLVRDFREVGITLDDKVWDYTRIFRLPHVTRNNARTWESPYSGLDIYPNNLLNPDTIEPGRAQTGANKNEYASLEKLNMSEPDEEDAAELLVRTGKAGNLVMSDWAKSAKKVLKGREVFEFLYQDAVIKDGERNEKLYKLLSSAIGLILNSPIEDLKETTPKHIFAVFLEPVRHMENAAHESWDTILWSMVCRIWEKEIAQIKATTIRDEIKEEKKLSKLDSIIEGMKQWNKDPKLLDPETNRLYVQEHCIAAAANSYFVMRSDGHYDDLPVTNKQLVARIRALNMDSLIPLTKTTANGQLAIRPAQEIIDGHATVLRTIEGVAGGGDGHIDNIDTPTARLILPLFKRKKKLEPKHNPAVEEWLFKMMGENDDRMRDICHWLGFALAFEDGPICALSLAGAPGAGKKMIVQALAEAIDTEVYATGKELDRFQSQLRYSPFLVINEGFPTVRAGMDPADAFRSLVGGDPILMEEKFQAPMWIRNPIRMIFTANNLDVISTLTAKRDLSPEDRNALAIRIKHFHVSEKAAAMLRMRGGLRYTARAGRAWIKNDATGISSYVVAKHFLHLYENRPAVAPGARFLMEGDLNSPVVAMMTTNSGASPEVIETILDMIQKPMKRSGLLIEDNTYKIWITAAAIVTHFREFLSKSISKNLNPKQVSNVLRGLSLSREPQRKILKTDTHKKGERAYWWELDLDTLYGYAVEYGLPNRKLETIMEASHKRDKFIDIKRRLDVGTNADTSRDTS